jgi:myo-inositol-1(or 4)-monophosphatase
MVERVPLSDAELAVAAADAGAAVVRARYGTSLARFDKSANDFATDADIEGEHAILEVLRSARPTDAYLGEELGVSGDTSSERVWLVDPLCGTLNFAAHTPLVAVNVALRDGGVVAVAAAADPFAGEVFWTDGKAAWVRREGVDRRLVPSSGTRLVDLDLDGPYPDVGASHVTGMLSDPAFRSEFGPRVLSTTLALGWLAAGRRAAYVTEGDLRDSVHFSSGIALCQAAGCVVTGLRGQPLHTGVGGLVAAADEDTHAALLAIVERQF